MAHDLKPLRNIGLASMGVVLEYFDFQVYVFVASALSVELFPPGNSIWTNQIQAFGIFAVGYLVRPAAGMIIAHYADRIGRKKLFVLTVVCMSVPTLLMGFLPTYAAAGWLAPAGLLTLRILQGCALGGELPSAAVFICEHAKWNRLGVASGIFIGMANCGLILGAGAALLARSIAGGLDPALASLAWRLPFIVGGLCGLLAAYLRRHLDESPMFIEIRDDKKLSSKMPMAAVVRDYPLQCVFAFALTFVFATTPGIYFQWLPSYLISIRHFPPDAVLKANVIGIAAFILSMPCWGLLRDRFGWPMMLIVAGVLNAGSAVWFFLYLPTLTVADMRLSMAIALVGALVGVTHSLIAGLISALFPTSIRQSGFALPYSLGTALISGLTPLVIAWLVRSHGLAAPMIQEIMAGAVALLLAGSLRFLPLYLGGGRASPSQTQR